MSRLCGSRTEDSLYACIETSPLGLPVEAFLVDPSLPWKGPQLRAPMIIADSKGVKHVFLGIGKQYYPTVPSFVDEAGIKGVSKRLPRDFDPEGLTPGQSKLILIHPKAIPRFPYNVEYTCPKGKSEEHQCIGALWPLSKDEKYADKDYSSGIILQFRKWHFEYINKKGRASKKLAESCDKTGWTLDVCHE